jgi:hypothetical protein
VDHGETVWLWQEMPLRLLLGLADELGLDIDNLDITTVLQMVFRRETYCHLYEVTIDGVSIGNWIY